MKLALIQKTLRDYWLLILVAMVALFGFGEFFVLAVKTIAPELLGFVRRFIFLRQIFQAMIGLDLSEGVNPTLLVIMGLLHPFVSVVTWSTLVTIGTRCPAGEIDRGTADLLLTLPVTRAGVYFSTGVVLILTALLLAAAVWTGLALGARNVNFAIPVDLSRIAMGSGNQIALLIAISGTTSLVSTMVDRRGAAIGIVAGLLLASFLINFLAVFLKFFQTIEFLGFLHYYRPVDIARKGEWPVSDLVVLTSVGVVTWTLGLLNFRRKDIPVA